MRIKSLKRKNVATVPSGYSGQERRFAQSVSEELDTLSGRRGDIIDRAVTFRDLIEANILELVSGRSITTGGGGGVNVVNPNDNGGGDGGLPTQLPTQPNNFTASGGFNVIFLGWDLPIYRGHDYIEIYRQRKNNPTDADPTLSDALAAGVYTRYYGDVMRFTDTNVGSQEHWYYWIRAVNIDGIEGPFFSETGVDATTALDYEFIDTLITEILTADSIALGLSENIAKIDPIGAALGTYQNYTGQAYIDFHESVVQQDQDGNSLSYILSGTFSEVFPNGSNSGSKITEIFGIVNDPVTGLAVLSTNFTSLNTTVTGTGGHSDQISALRSVLEDPATGNLLQANALHTLQTNVGDIEGDIYDSQGNLVVASASDVTSLETVVYNPTTGVAANRSAINVQASSINGIESKFAVKIDNNGHVSGFGLISTTNTDNSSTSSSFIVAADRFAIGVPYNSNAGVTPRYPFKVFTTATTVNGVSIPSGVYIDDAFIHNAQITGAQIKSATITNANIADLSATKITSGNIIIDAQNNISIRQGKTTYGGTANGFWLGNLNGSGAFNLGNATNYVRFNGSVLEITGASINDASIETLKLAGDAVTVPDGDFASGLNISIGNSFTTVSGYTYLSDWDSDGVPSAILLSGHISLMGGDTSGSSSKPATASCRFAWDWKTTTGGWSTGPGGFNDTIGYQSLAEGFGGQAVSTAKIDVPTWSRGMRIIIQAKNDANYGGNGSTTRRCSGYAFFALAAKR